MGKSKRKRKIKEEDFKKKKLKVGKRLPMPDNVTKTSFKARSISIQQNQDGGHGEQHTNFKQQNLKDLLSSCSHYNTQAREEALLGLKDLIEKHPNVLKDNLNGIFQRILGKITDIENSVRRAFLSLIWSVFKSLSMAEISPFFPSVMAYLSSAMTHLNEVVRMDSMKLLDHCIHFYPRLLSRHSKNVIQNFLDVISSEKATLASSKKPGIAKTLLLKAKVTSQKTQLQVLTRLNHLLHVMSMVHHDDDGGSSGGDSGYGGGASGHNGGSFGHDGGFTGDNSIVGEFAADGKCVDGYGTSGGRSDCTIGNGAGSPKTIHIANLKDGASLPSFTTYLVSDFSLKTSCGGASSMPSADLLGNEVQLMEFIASLSPVLFEYWIECCPAEFVMNLIPINKTSISLQIMKEVLEIFVTLLGSLERVTSDQEVFIKFVQDTLFGKFNSHFMSVFPMSFTVQQAGSWNKKETMNQSITDVELNLLICELLCYVIPKEHNDNLPKWVTNIFIYLSKVMKDRSKGGNSQATLHDIKTLTKLIKVLLLNLPNNCNDLQVKLLKNMYQLFTASHAMSNTKKVLLNFLQDILQGLTSHLISPELKATIDVWLCSLVKLATYKELAQSTVNNIFTVCKLGILQNFTKLPMSVTTALPGILNAETFLRFGKETQLLVLDILYHLKQAPSRELYEVLSKLCNSGGLLLVVVQRLMQVIYQLANPDSPNQVSVLGTSNYLSFALSVIVGQTQDKLTKLQSNSKSYNCFSHPVSEVNILVTDPSWFSKEGEQNLEALKEAWKYQKSLISIICQYISLSDYSEYIGEMMTHPLSKLFGQYTTLPLPLVYHLLSLVPVLFSLVKTNEVAISNPLPTHLAKWCAVLWHFVLSLNSDEANFEFFQSILGDVKGLTKNLVKASCNILQSLLELLQTCTSSTRNSQTLSCKVVTELLKSGAFQGHGNNYQPYLDGIKRNLEGASNASMVESQTYSDFKYQYSYFMQVNKVELEV